MELQLDDPMERFSYFVGCYWGIDVTATVFRFLRRGDCFVDVGANLGFLTLTAAKKVGPDGKVFSFEPLAGMADRLRRMLINNTIENVTVHQCALGDIESEDILDHDEHSSKANLRGANKNGEKIKIMLGDHVLNDFVKDIWVFAKLDVEGYELRVLKGFQLVHRPKTGFLVEITDEWLRDMGGSADELFDLMLGSGFKAYIPKVTLFSQFELRPISRSLTGRQQYDVVFLRPEIVGFHAKWAANRNRICAAFFVFAARGAGPREAEGCIALPRRS